MQYKEKRKVVQEHFKNENLVMINMNDYAATSLIGKNILSYLQEQIGTGLKLNASFLSLNKAEHINLMLEYNLTVEEIKLAQALSMYSSIETLLEQKGKDSRAKDVFLDATDTVLKKMFKPTEMDKYIGISDLIKSTTSPIIIHSTGANDLMRILGTNPYQIDRDFSNRENSGVFEEAKKKARDPKTVRIVLDEVDKNFRNILTLNPNSMMVSLGLYIPEVLKQKKYKDFRNLIYRYNYALKELCSSYNTKYVDTVSIKNRTIKSPKDFNLSQQGQKELAKAIVEELYAYLTGLPVINLDLDEQIEYRTSLDLKSYYIDKLNSINSSSASKERKSELALERIKEKRILEKVLQTRKNL